MIFSKLFSELWSLEIGVNIGSSIKDYYNIKCFLLFASFDKPARAAALNMINSTGFYGCLKCTQKGVSVKTESKIFQIILHTFQFYIT